MREEEPFPSFYVNAPPHKFATDGVARGAPAKLSTVVCGLDRPVLVGTDRRLMH